jgi:threonine aldolase
MNFGSDNQSGASNKVLHALVEANTGPSAGYGNDEWTVRAEEKLKQVFECELKAYFVTSGTAANCLALSCMANPWDMILCHAHAHIINDELTAPELFTGGARVQGLDENVSKLSSDGLGLFLESFDGHPPHTPMPKVLSLSQLTESGQVYELDELQVLCRKAKEYGMTVHMDGARFANALVSLDCTPAEMTWQAGVDVLCLGASKNGALAAEAVIFFDTTLAHDFEFRRKRSGHLLSKGRYLGAQFLAWLDQDHWLMLAKQANDFAREIATAINSSEKATLAWPVCGNEVFVLMDEALIDALRVQGAIFYEWPMRFLSEGQLLSCPNAFILVRLVVSHSTPVIEVNNLVCLIEKT